MRTHALVASALATALVACGDPDFNRPALLDKPRILAVRAEPPQPSFGVATTLSTLLYEPPLDRVADKCPSPRAPTYKWSWCPWPMSANSQYECPIQQADFDQLYLGMGLGKAPSLDLGTGETATFTNPFPAPMLFALCRGDIGTMPGGAPASDTGAEQSIFNCLKPASDVAANVKKASESNPIAFRATVKVEITPACPELLPAGFSPLVAVYSLYLPTNDAVPVNQNPVLDGIFVTENWVEARPGDPPAGGDTPPDGGIASDDGGTSSGVDGGIEPDARLGHDGPDGSVVLDDEARVLVKRDKHIGLALDIEMTTADYLAVPSSFDYNSRDKLTRHYEHLDFAWYAEAGDFTGEGKGETTGWLPTAFPEGQDSPPWTTPLDVESFEFNTTNTWDLPRFEDYQYPTARIVVVVRDGRGGVAWTSKIVTLEDKP